jgi:DNA polymerase delta subunit 1
MNQPLEFQLWDICAKETTEIKGIPRGKQGYQSSMFTSRGVYQDISRDAEDDEDQDDENEFAITTRILLYGKTKDGLTVVAHVPYCGYFYMEVPEWMFSKDAHLRDLQQQIARSVRLPPRFLTFTKERHQRAYGWVPKSNPDGTLNAKETATFPMLKFRFPSNKTLSIAAAIWKKKTNVRIGMSTVPSFPVWESKVPLTTKFMDEYSLTPSGWVQITQHSPTTIVYCHCDHEVMALSPVVPMDDTSIIAPLIIASVDIECYSQSRAFPVEGKDPVIGIGTSIKVYGGALERYYFALGDCVIPEEHKHLALHVQTFSTEKELVLGWRDFMIQRNPDIVTGYNINRFDFKYLGTVMEKDQDRFFYWSRLWAEDTPLSSSGFSSNAYGDSNFFTFQMGGRLVVDLLEVIRRGQNLRSYKLEEVAKKFLKCPQCKRSGNVKQECNIENCVDCDNTRVEKNEKKTNDSDLVDCDVCGNQGGMHKIDLPPLEIFKKYEGSALDRGEIAVYCSMDCDLVVELITQMSTLQSLVEMSRVTQTPIQDIISKGQQAKVLNQLVWFSHRNNLVLNDATDVPLVGKYQGASVLEPQPNFYEEPIATLDFESLYPSIMIQNNLCCSTWVCDPRYQKLSDAKYLEIDAGQRQYSFVQHITGIVPKILKHLLAARKAVRKQMAQEKDPMIKSLLNAKQLAIKVSCNSVYGFFGTGLKGKYPCLPISESTTCIGRSMIYRLKETIETKYPGSVVVYGDTDSVMIKFALQGTATPVKESFKLGSEICVLAHEMFGENINLTMEKVFEGYLLQKKKRYCGMAYESPDKPPKMLTKGLECVRRDVPLFVVKVQSRLLDALVRHRNPEAARKILVSSLEQLIQDTLPFDNYEMTFMLKAKYKTEQNKQMVIVNKAKQRSPGSEPKSGERVAYVLTDTGKSKCAEYEQVEEASFALENKLKLDRLAYLNKKFKTPILAVIETFLPEEECKKLFRHAESELTKQSQKLQDIRLFFQKAASQPPQLSPPPPDKTGSSPPKDKKEPKKIFCCATGTKRTGNLSSFFQKVNV